MAPVLAVAFVALLARMTLAVLIVPPWQNADEPIHVAAAEAWRSRITGDDAQDRGREAEIIDSMIRHGWWRHYGQPLPPGPQPTRFVSTGAVFSTIGLVPESSSYAPPYYAAVGWLMSLGPRGPVERDMYVARAVSMVFAATTLLIAYRSSRLALDALSAGTIAALLALHPQFAIVSTTAAPDAAVNCAGAVMWWQTISAFRDSHALRALAIVWLSALAAAAIDPMGIALIPFAFFVTVAVSWRRLGARAAAGVLVVAALGVVVAATAVPAIRNPITISMREAVVPASMADGLAYGQRFITFLFGSWWYSLGWVRYSPPGWWVAVVAALTLAAVVGIARRYGPRTDASRTIVILAAANVLCLLAALGWVFLRVQVGAQGRYLFPAIVPTVTLLWLGTVAWLPGRWRQAASIALLTAFAVLDAAVWTLVAVPAYT